MVRPVQIENRNALGECLKNWRAVHGSCLLAILFVWSSGLGLQSQQRQHIRAYLWLVMEYSCWAWGGHNNRCIGPCWRVTRFARGTWFPKTCRQLISNHLQSAKRRAVWVKVLLLALRKVLSVKHSANDYDTTVCAVAFLPGAAGGM